MTAFRFPRIRAFLSSVFFNPYKALSATKRELFIVSADAKFYAGRLPAVRAERDAARRVIKSMRGEVLELREQRNAAAGTFRNVVRNWQDLVNAISKDLEGHAMANDAFMAEREELQQSISAFQKEREELKGLLAEAGFQGLATSEVAQGLLEGLQSISADNAALIDERDELAAHIPYLKAVEAALAAAGVVVSDTEEGPVVTIDVPTVVAGLKSGATKAMPQPIPA